MTIQIDSTTDSKEAVTAALGDLAKPKDAVETPSEKLETEVDPKPGNEPVTKESTEVEEPTEPENEDDPEDELEAKTEDETEEPKAKKKGGFQKRIDKLSKQKSDLEREKEYWRQEALRTKAPAEKVETPAVVAKDLSLRPKNEDFETHDAYVEALTDWKLDQKLSQREQKQKDDVVKNEIQTKLNTHQSRVDAFKSEHDDFEEVLENCAGIVITPAVQQSIVESDHGPELMYEFGQDPEEYKRICSLPYGAAMREMGKLEATFSKTVTKSSSETTTTKAPKPVTTLRPRGAAATKDFDDPRSTQHEYEMAREKQIKQNSMRR